MAPLSHGAVPRRNPARPRRSVDPGPSGARRAGPGGTWAAERRGAPPAEAVTAAAAAAAAAGPRAASAGGGGGFPCAAAGEEAKASAALRPRGRAGQGPCRAGPRARPPSAGRGRCRLRSPPGAAARRAPHCPGTAAPARAPPAPPALPSGGAALFRPSGSERGVSACAGTASPGAQTAVL